MLRTPHGSAAILARIETGRASVGAYAASAKNCSASDPSAKGRTCPLRIMFTNSSPASVARAVWNVRQPGEALFDRRPEPLRNGSPESPINRVSRARTVGTPAALVMGSGVGVLNPRDAGNSGHPGFPTARRAARIARRLGQTRPAAGVNIRVAGHDAWHDLNAGLSPVGTRGGRRDYLEYLAPSE